MAEEPTSNEKALDETVRRLIYILRFAEGEADKVARMLVELEGDILEKVGGALARGVGPERLESLLKSVKDLQSKTFTKIEEVLQEDLDGLAKAEAAWEAAMIERVVPVVLKTATVRVETLLGAARAPIQGMRLKGWLDGIEADSAAKLERAVVMGISQGETIPQIVARIRGTAEASYSNGVLSATRYHAQALARTAVNHTSNNAREVVWAENADLILCLRWTSVLDGRTTFICMARDGHVAPVVGHELPEEIGDPPLDPPYARPQ